jgi:Ca2+-binding EF-hand superfamily protein
MVVYNRLLLRSNREDALSFHVLAMLALHSNGTLKQEKVKELIHMFRPDRDGTLSVLDFVKSVDDVVRVN